MSCCEERSAAAVLAAEPEAELRIKRAEVDFGAALCGLTILRCGACLWMLTCVLCLGRVKTELHGTKYSYGD